MRILLLLALAGVQRYIWGIRSSAEVTTTEPPEEKIYRRIETACLGKCSGEWHKGLRSALGPNALDRIRRLDVSEVINMFSKESSFKGFCKAYVEFHECSQECPSSYVRDILHKGLRMLDKYCVHSYRDIVKYFPCLRKASMELQKEKTECMGDCKKHFATVQGLGKDWANLILRGQNDEMQEKMTSACKYPNPLRFVRCSLDCDYPLVEDRCGIATANLVRDLSLQSVEVLEEIAESTGSLDTWPEECSSLSDYTYIPPTTTPHTWPVEPLPQLPASAARKPAPEPALSQTSSSTALLPSLTLIALLLLSL